MKNFLPDFSWEEVFCLKNSPIYHNTTGRTGIMLSFGLFFYWSSWLIWIMVTFFMTSRQYQQLLMISILMVIILANQYYMIGHFQISLAYSMILIGSCVMYRILKRQHYHLIVAFTLMIGYSGMIIWKNITPLWLFVPELLLIPLFCSCLVFVLAKGLKARLLTTMLGLSTGELFCS